jgi:OPA family glycerol-3-phosphate transporter-like MFS transporter/OPA family sugar phosphate sensor protein UhpC-like MFS transporter
MTAAPSADSAAPSAGSQSPAFRRWQLRTLLATMLGYALFYFVRKNFSMAMPGIEQELGITKTALGAFLTANGLVYGLSRFANGLLADRFNGRWHMSAGLALCALSNLAIGFAPEVALWLGDTATGTAAAGAGSGVLRGSAAVTAFIGITWVVNGFLQGSGFPPCARLLTHWIPPSELATKMSVWNTSHSIGAGLVVVLCGYVMSNFGVGDAHLGAWQWCFWLPASIALCGALALFALLRDTPTSVGLPELPETKVTLRKGAGAAAGAAAGGAEYRAFLREKVFANPIIWLLGVANFFVYVVRFSVLDWGPTLLRQSKGVSMAGAGWLVALFEVAGIIGMLVAGSATDRWFGGRAHRACAVCMTGAAIAAFIFWQIPAGAPAWALLAPLCATGFFIYGPQALVGIAAANQATKKAAATANGLTGIFGYASTALSGLGFGYVAEHFGWDFTYIAVIATALAGLLVFLAMWNAKATGYDNS